MVPAAFYFSAKAGQGLNNFLLFSPCPVGSTSSTTKQVQHALKELSPVYGVASGPSIARLHGHYLSI